MLVCGMCIMKHREAYMMSSLRRAADWNMSDISCDGYQNSQHSVGRGPGGAIRQNRL